MASTTVVHIESALTILSTPDVLSITSLSEPLLQATSTSTKTPESSHPRSSTSSSTTDSPSLLPSNLISDLTHHKSLFSKLRFSYTSQVTKEKFLKSIISDPPLIVDATTLRDLEPVLVEAKASLKAKKRGVEDMLGEMEELARNVARRKIEVDFEVAELQTMPERMLELGDRIQVARLAAPVVNPVPEMNFGVEETREVLEERTAGAEALQSRVEEVREAIRKRKMEVEELRGEAEAVEGRKRGAIKEAVEARRRRGTGLGDVVELKGRWARGCGSLLKGMLEIED